MTNLELLLLILAILGGIDLAWRGMSLVAAAFPIALTAQARAWRMVSDVIAIRAFKRRAIATQIEEVLNLTAYELQQYLPKGWIRRAKIAWVRNGHEAFLADGEIILRIRPQTDSNQCLMQSLWVYFQRALFPDARGIMPETLLHSIALAVSRAAIEKSHPYLLNTFDNGFLSDVGRTRAEVLEKFSDCVRLNGYGFLMGPFVREVDHVIQQLRFQADKRQLAETADVILAHMLSFQPLLRLPTKPEAEWALNAHGASYAFLLVSRPPELRAAVDAYIKRVQVHIQNGVGRIYVIGRDTERDFVHMVAKALLSIRELKGTELFSLFRDYRGDEGGIGVLLTIDGFVSKLHLAPRQPEVFVPKLEVSPIGADTMVSATPHDLIVGPMDELERIVQFLLIQLSDYERAWISLAELGGRLRQQMPDFTPEQYGGKNLFSVLKKLSFLEFEERGAGPAKAVWVRSRSDVPSSISPSAAQSEKAIWSRVEQIVRTHSHENGWIFLGTLGHYLKVEMPGFSFQEHGAETLHEFVSSIPSLEIEERGDGHSKTYVRLRR